MAIYPKTETRRAKRRNGAAYQHRRLRSLIGGHSVITHGRRMEYQRSHSMFLTHGIAGTVGTSWSDRALLPRKRARNAISHRIKRRIRGGKNRTRVKPSTRVFCPTPIAPKTKTHVRTHVDPGRAPRRHPHLRETPRNTLFRSVRTYSRSLCSKIITDSGHHLFCRRRALCGRRDVALPATLLLQRSRLLGLRRLVARRCRAQRFIAGCHGPHQPSTQTGVRQPCAWAHAPARIR
jgi:hypothetical protein